jgi:hypothetical protein
MPVLTDTAVKKYKPAPNSRREIPDTGTPGLRLVIQSSGHKSWAMRFRRPVHLSQRPEEAGHPGRAL